MPVIQDWVSAFRCQTCGGFRRGIELPAPAAGVTCSGTKSCPHPAQAMTPIEDRGQDETPDLNVEWSD